MYINFYPVQTVENKNRPLSFIMTKRVTISYNLKNKIGYTLPKEGVL